MDGTRVAITIHTSAWRRGAGLRRTHVHTPRPPRDAVTQGEPSSASTEACALLTDLAGAVRATWEIGVGGPALLG